MTVRTLNISFAREMNIIFMFSMTILVGIHTNYVEIGGNTYIQLIPLPVWKICYKDECACSKKMGMLVTKMGTEIGSLLWDHRSNHFLLQDPPGS